MVQVLLARQMASKLAEQLALMMAMFVLQTYVMVLQLPAHTPQEMQVLYVKQLREFAI